MNRKPFKKTHSGKYLSGCFIFLPALLFLFETSAFSQKGKDTTTKVITISNTLIKDCLLTEKYIWLLREDGKIVRADPDNNVVVDSFGLPKKIVAIGKSPDNTIYSADEEGSIFSIRDDRNIDPVWKTGQNVQHFVFTNDGKCFLITDKGIFSPSQNRVYYENAFTNLSLVHYNTSSWHPSAFYIDQEDNIWLGFSAGEWGGDIILFSTSNFRFTRFRDRQKKFYYVRPVRSFFQIDTVMYATTSLQHMSSLSSSIIEITDTCHYFFQSPLYSRTLSDPDSADNLYKKTELYMGPSLFNKNDNSIYFYCQYGVFKGDISKDLSKLENWKHVLETKFMWYYGMPDAVGYGMNVSKMFFEKDRLVMVSPSNGVLIWDGFKKVLYRTVYKPED